MSHRSRFRNFSATRLKVLSFSVMLLLLTAAPSRECMGRRIGIQHHGNSAQFREPLDLRHGDHAGRGIFTDAELHCGSHERHLRLAAVQL